MAKRAEIFTTDDSQAVRLPTELQFDNTADVLIYRQGRKVILEPQPTRWSQRFLDLAGSAPDFPYPEEPPPADPGPEFD